MTQFEQLANRRVLVTGGAGYIGSHTLLHLIAEGAEVLVLDNFSNSSPEALRRVGEIAKHSIPYERIDLLDWKALEAALRNFEPDAIIHFAGLKSVGESVAEPLRYYENNVSGSINLLSAMEKSGCNRIIFSSSATVYGKVERLPIDESHPLCPSNPYGETKWMVERIIEDWTAASPERSALSLRYFNPVGAHDSARIGEDPQGIPNNLMPFIAQVAAGLRPELLVHGNDFDTRDGTGERDYIHVDDLAAGHVAALKRLFDERGYDVFNLGTGRGNTVLEVISSFSVARGEQIPYRFGPRRPGDTAVSVADPCKAQRLLGWKAQRNLADACRSSWKWQTENPRGFRRPENE